LRVHEILHDRRAVTEDESERGGYAPHPDVGEQEAGVRQQDAHDEQADRDEQRAQRVEADDEDRTHQRGDDRQHGRQGLRHLANRVAPDEGLEGIGVNLDARHIAAAGKRRREDVVLHLARGADQHDLGVEQSRRDLASHHPVVRHPRKRPGPAAEVDEDLLGGG